MSSVASLAGFTARVVGAAAVVTVLAVRVPAAPPGDIPRLDHFRCYSIILGAVSAPENVFVQLQDQFDSALEEFVVGFNPRFCNPVAKTLQGPGQGMGQTTDVIDANAHLVLYRIHGQSQSRATRKVSIEDLLCVPTQKRSWFSDVPDPSRQRSRHTRLCTRIGWLARNGGDRLFAVGLLAVEGPEAFGPNSQQPNS